MSEWERLDTAASVPRRATSSSTLAEGPRPVRFRRRSNLVLAALDSGGRVFQQRLRDCSLGAAVILVPAVALNLWVTIVASDRFDPDAAPVPDTASAGREDVGVFLAAVFVSSMTAIVGFLCCTILFGDRFHRPVTLTRALRHTVRRLPAVLFAWLLTHWWFVLMAALIAVSDGDGLIGLIVLFGLISWPASSATLMVVPAMVAEGLGPYRAAVRSWKLAKQRFGGCMAFVLLTTTLGLAFGTGILTMVPLLESFGFVRFGDATEVVLAVMGQLAVLLVVPLVAMATAQLYLELRVAAEGLDLTVDAERAFGPVSS